MTEYDGEPEGWEDHFIEREFLVEEDLDELPDGPTGGAIKGAFYLIVFTLSVLAGWTCEGRV